MSRPCPSCPDGYVWNREGSTGATCPTCGGKAYIGEEEEKHFFHDLKTVISEQANDEALWFDAGYATEAYLQRALRRLHAEVEEAMAMFDEMREGKK